MPSCLIGLAPPPPAAHHLLVLLGRRRMASTAAGPSRAFQLRLNPLTGDSEWLVVDEEADGEGAAPPLTTPAAQRQLLAATSYLDMLNDAARNRAYRRAIEAAITDPAARVLDIGAGTGLLSMMSARALGNVRGESSGSVSACESYLPMGKLLRKVLRANGMENKVKVFHKRSDELEVGVELDSPANILVSEILDSELLGEGLIPTLQQAHDMLLVKNPKTVPYRATTYGQMHDLHNNEANAADGVWLTPDGMENIVSVKLQQHAMQCDPLQDEIRLLSEPFKVFEFDFSERPDSHRENKITIKTTGDGCVHAIISWWVLQLDSAGSIFYSTAPRWARQSSIEDLPKYVNDTKDWCDHWKHCVWFTHGKGAPVMEDQILSLRASHNLTSISYQLLNANDEACNGSLKGDQLALLPERVALYGDRYWRSALITVVKNALRDRSSQTCIVADDSIFLALLVSSLSPSSKVIAMFPGLRDRGAAYLQAVADANNFSMDQIQVIGKRVASVTADDLKHKKVNLLMGEPFYYGGEGMLPWQNLRFWLGDPSLGWKPRMVVLNSSVASESLRTICSIQVKPCRLQGQSIKREWREYMRRIWNPQFTWEGQVNIDLFQNARTLLDPMLSKDALIVPCKGVLKLCAMSLPDLWRSRCSLKDVEGFDHSVVNETLGACGDLPGEQQGPCLPYYVWQCGHTKKLSKVYSLMDFNFFEPIHSCFGKTKIEFADAGTCHGFALWIDWVLDEKNFTVLSTGPDSRYWKQGVQLLSKPVEVNPADSAVHVEASFDPASGDLTFSSLFS